jgi:hypothetical protein
MGSRRHQSPRYTHTGDNAFRSAIVFCYDWIISERGFRINMACSSLYRSCQHVLLCFSVSTLSFSYSHFPRSFVTAVSASSSHFQNIVLHSESCTKTLARRSGNEPLSTSIMSLTSFSERAWSEFFLFFSFLFHFLDHLFGSLPLFAGRFIICAVFWVSRARNG